jgi:hypothetical protein
MIYYLEPPLGIRGMYAVHVGLDWASTKHAVSSLHEPRGSWHVWVPVGVPLTQPTPGTASPHTGHATAHPARPSAHHDD